MTVASLWDELLAAEEVAYAGTEPARAARTAQIPDELHPRLRAALEAQGLDSLYEHQAEAWEAAARGEHVVVTTGTASGKTLAFNLPVLDSLARDAKRRALYLYPTKALAQDQLRALGAFALPRLRPEIYDGDTPSEARWRIRRWANVVLTNPDMLHVGVLPHHDRWADVLHNLRWVIVDEAHVYRGVFGSHVGNVLRRLRRLARVYGAEPQFVFASATIANPGELATRLTGSEFRLIDDDPAEVGEEVAPLRMVGQQADVQHVGVCEHEVGAAADRRALLARGVAVIDRLAQIRRPQLVQLSRLVLGQCLGRIQVERPRAGVARQHVEDRQVETQ